MNLGFHFHAAVFGQHRIKSKTIARTLLINRNLKPQSSADLDRQIVKNQKVICNVNRYFLQQLRNVENLGLRILIENIRAHTREFKVIF